MAAREGGVVAARCRSEYNADMTTEPAIITLLTDFGDQDSYVGAMKGVILGIAPRATLVDVTHRIAPQDIHQAATVLSGTYPYYPPQTVHLIVVDPGVGGQRRPVAMATPHGRFVAPDNGVLSYVQRREPEARAVVLENKQYWRDDPSHTFHGRDIFSPVAAHLAAGVPLEEFGPPCNDLVQLAVPRLTITPESIRGQVSQIDHFGNVLTNIATLHWADSETIEFAPHDAGPSSAPLTFRADRARVATGWHTLHRLNHAYGEVPPGQPLALVSSGGELEIAVNQGSAGDKLGLKVGDPVSLYIES